MTVLAVAAPAAPLSNTQRQFDVIWSEVIFVDLINMHVLVQDPPVTEDEKDIDILFYGWIVPGSRRNELLDKLRFERNVSIHVSNMDVYKCALYIVHPYLGKTPQAC